MKRHIRLLPWLATIIILAGWTSLPSAAPIDDLIAEARKEAIIEFYLPRTFPAEGGHALAGAFNKQYGLNIKFQYHRSGNMNTDVAKVVVMAATGGSSEWDLMVVTDAHHATLWLRKLHQPFDYRKLGVDPRVIHYDNGTISFSNQIVLPAYNKKFLSPQDAPKRWEDLLDPKWKGGKLGVGTAVHHFSRLATVWGEEKATKYVKALAKQEPYLGRQGELFTRLQIGEILVAVNLIDSELNVAQKAGAPIAHAVEVQPVISPAYHAGVPKGARHPNVGHLLAAFLTASEAQQIWEKYGGQTSAFVSGTATQKYLQGKEVVYMNQRQAKMIDRLAREYGKVLGFER